MQTPEGFRKRYNVDVRVNAAALDCDPKGKRLLVKVRFLLGGRGEGVDRLTAWLFRLVSFETRAA